MKNKVIGALALFATSTGSGIMLLEGLSLKSRVACVVLVNAGTVLASIFKLPSSTKTTPKGDA